MGRVSASLDVESRGLRECDAEGRGPRTDEEGEIWRGTVAVQEGAKRCLRIGTGRSLSSHTLLVGPQRHSLTASASRTHALLAICVCPIPLSAHSTESTLMARLLVVSPHHPASLAGASPFSRPINPKPTPISMARSFAESSINLLGK